MASLDWALTRQALAKGIVRQVNNDAAIGIRLRYIGTGTVTSVTTDNDSDLELITSDGGTDTYDFTVAPTDTVGGVVDAINKDGIFEARVIDALRADDADTYFIDGLVSAGEDGNGVVSWDLLVDCSSAAVQSICLSPLSPDWDQPTGHRVHLQEIFYNVNNTAAADGLTLWKRKGNVETELFHILNVDDTDTTVTFASGEGKITAGPDEELIVQFDGTVIDDATGNSVRLVGIHE